MAKAILGTKIGMTQVFTTDGRTHAATVIHAEPNTVLQVMTKEKDGYNALKVGYKTVAEKSLNKPELGQFKDTGTPKKFIKEFRNMEGFAKGESIAVNVFEAGEYVNAQARTKGHGFTGSIKRHNFKIGPMGHGAGYPHRYVGSVSGGRGGSQAQRVFKGHPLPGHWGNELTTIQNLLILDVNTEKNYIIVKGAIPGPKGQIITLRDSVKYAGVKEEITLVKNEVATPKVETPKVEVAKAEEPKVETPNVEVAKAEKPKVETPKVEVAKAEEPNVEVVDQVVEASAKSTENLDEKLAAAQSKVDKEIAEEVVANAELQLAQENVAKESADVDKALEELEAVKEEIAAQEENK